MPEIKGVENLYLVVAFIVPGLIISFVRAQYITGRSKTHTENILSYLILSLIYYGIALPGFEAAIEIQGSRWLRWVAWLAFVVGGPAAIGLLLGLIAQSGIGRRIAHKLGFNPVHSFPTSWDWIFSEVSKGNGLYVTVTLTDGSVSGFFGDKSFVSSDPSERDLYIEQIWDVTEDGRWEKCPDKAGVLIPSKEIKQVRFFTLGREASTNEQ